MKTLVKKRHYLTSFTLALLISVSGLHALPVYAQDTFKDSLEDVSDFAGDAGFTEHTSLIDAAFAVLKIVGSFIAIIALGALLYGGFKYITSLGQPDEIDKAKRIIIYAIVGLIVIGLSAMIVNVVLSL